jgi:hypothetical protein
LIQVTRRAGNMAEGRRVVRFGMSSDKSTTVVEVSNSVALA